MQFEHNLSNHYYSVGHTFLPLCNTVHIFFFPRAGRMTKAQLPWQPWGYLLAPIRQPDRHNALVWKESPKTPEKHTGTLLERCWAIQNRNSIKGLSVSRKNEKNMTLGFCMRGVGLISLLQGRHFHLPRLHSPDSNYSQGETQALILMSILRWDELHFKISIVLSTLWKKPKTSGSVLVFLLGK